MAFIVSGGLVFVLGTLVFVSWIYRREEGCERYRYVVLVFIVISYLINVFFVFILGWVLWIL